MNLPLSRLLFGFSDSAVGEGAFGQHGPFRPTMRGLVKNPYSWNKAANLLYLDSPAGVGFSYSTNLSDYLLVTDEMAARDHLVFLQHWFNKFPEFKTNEFFIAGQGYAGHFAPQLAQLILETKSEINLKGIAIGNPLLDYDNDYNSTADFLWSHAQISDLTYWKLKNKCGYASITKEYITEKSTKACQDTNTKMSIEVNGYTNSFNVYANTCPAAPENEEYLQQTGEKAYVCTRDATNAYMDKQETLKALHASLVGIQKWSICSKVLYYNPYEQFNPTINLLGTLVRSGVRILVFSGDSDSVIPFMGTRSLIREMAEDFGFRTTRDYQAWFQDGQVAGWSQVFEDILTYATILGEGHSDGVSQPKNSLLMLKTFLEGKPLPERHPFPKNGHKN
ncbi:serine carboxypeptidase-like 45 [Vicia villosa]|uniref:serine carboxypeptidase-like 45 n=1 Tax=Vicia villosa TaxID=3911 RepID=UPI00273C1534|nr:serine carboxypeptidase-like 45 [Vicia villosa]